MKKPNIATMVEDHLDWMTTIAFSSGVPEFLREEWKSKREDIEGIVNRYCERQRAAAKAPRIKSKAKQDIRLVISKMARWPKGEFRNKEIWEHLITELGLARYQFKETKPNKFNPKTWSIKIDGEEKPYKYSTFQTQLSNERRKLSTNPG